MAGDLAQPYRRRICVTEQNWDVLWSGFFGGLYSVRTTLFCGQEQKWNALWSGLFGFVAFQNKTGRFVVRIFLGCDLSEPN